MRNSILKIFALACLVASPFSGCVSDGGTEIPNEVRGTLYTSNGKPAANATITLYPVNYLPGLSGAKRSAEPVKISVKSDASGKYAVANVPSGQYNILATTGSASAFQDSVTITGLGISRVTADTLKLDGTLFGQVRLQPQHSPQTVVVQVLGSDFYTNVSEDGSFSLSLPRGTYRLKVASVLPNYVPLFVTVSVTSGSATELETPLEPFYSGIPVVTGLKATPDSSGRIALRWNKPKSNTIQAYLIYRDTENDLTPSTVVHRSTTDTVYLDTIYSATPKTGQYSITDTIAHQYTYRIRVLDFSTEIGPAYYTVSLKSVPPSKWVQSEQGWFTVNANAPSNGFIRFTSSNTGYLFQGIDYHKTTDGGVTWIKAGGTFGAYGDASFPSLNVGYILISGRIYVYKISGTSGFATEVSPSPALYGTFAMDFPTVDTGFIAGSEGQILKTVNGGVDWKTNSSGSKQNLYSIRCFNSERCFAAGDSGTIVKTTNGGQSWSSLATGTTKEIRALNITSVNSVYAIAGNNTLLKTTNGGTSWTSKQLPVIQVGGLYFLNSTTGYAGGSEGVILSTTDGGLTWDSENVAGSLSVGDIQCIQNVCYATASPATSYPPVKSITLKRYLSP